MSASFGSPSREVQECARCSRVDCCRYVLQHIDIQDLDDPVLTLAGFVENGIGTLKFKIAYDSNSHEGIADLTEDDADAAQDYTQRCNALPRSS